MNLLAVALDFDGTIATNDVLEPSVRQAIATLRAHKIVTLIVTGRILSDLERVAGDLHFIDAIVAENGAVLHFPDTAYTRVLSGNPSTAFLNALHQESIAFSSGRTIVEAASTDASRILAIIQRLEMPLALSFNRGRVMILPQAISKATGLREIFKILRLSPHNAIAFGDAENDHELLQSCEFGVAVGWGSAQLKEGADYVLAGQGPAAVATYLFDLLKEKRIPLSSKIRRTLMIGHTDIGSPFEVGIKGRTVLIAGETRSGKSWVASLLCEQAILMGYSHLIIDPEGDYTSLEALPGVVVFGGRDPLPRPRDIMRSMRHADLSMIIDLSHTPHNEKVEYVQNLLISIAAFRRHTGLPHRIILDEAHYFLSDHSNHRLLDHGLGGYTLVSYKASWLPPEVLHNATVILVTRECDPQETRMLRGLCPSCGDNIKEDDWAPTFRDLSVGEVIALPLTNEAAGRLERIRLAPKLTPHIRHVAKYIDMPVSESNQFVFWRGNTRTTERARTLRQLVLILESWPLSALDGHLCRNDFSRWIANVFGDYPLAKTIEMIEHQYQIGDSALVLPNLIEAIRSRYDFVEVFAEHQKVAN